MKNLRLIIMSLCCIGSYMTASAQVQQTCGTDDAVNVRANSTIDFAKFRADLNMKIYDYQTMQAKNPAASGQAGKLLPSPFVMPTVVHIVHNGEAVGTGSNLSDATVISAIADLNSRLSNANGNGVDMNVQLCLAVRDPNNLPTNGITRYDASGIPGFSAAGVNYSSGCGGADPNPIFTANDWPFQSYFNIYIFTNICGTTAWTDFYGCYFKAVSYTPTLNGPLQAHEVGHYLGLGHVFNGDGGGANCPVNTNCLVDGDGVCDTPPIKSGDCASSTCTLPPGGILTNSTYNYLSYCFGQWDRYTQGQKDRVTAAQNFAPLSLLPVSLGCVPLSANDAGIQAIVSPISTTYTTACGGDPYATAPVVQLRNYGTSSLTSVNIKYQIDNGTISNYAWSGSLASYAAINVTLAGISIPQGTHSFKAYTTQPNGVTDPYNPNDTADVSVTITGPSVITATSSQTSTTCAGNDGTATVNPSGGTLQNVYNNLTNWESPHSWTIVNGSQPNVWCVGAAVANGGSYSAYVSDVTHNCADNNITGAQYSTVHMYKDFTFPANASNIQISFDWRNSQGFFDPVTDSSNYLATYLVTTGVTPVAGTALGSGQIGTRYYNNSSFSTKTLGGLDGNINSTKRLVFSWINDWYAFNPAGAVDNINISYTQTFNYTYLWSNGQTTQTATGLAAGTYTCTIADGQGCTKTKSVTVLNGCGGSVSISANGPTTFCSGGSVLLTSSLPSGNVWSTGATTQSISVNASGNYNCTNNGNTSNTIAVTVNPKPTATVTANGPTTFCKGGSVTLSAPARGNALQLDGNDDYASPSVPMIPVTGSYTVLFWAKEGVNQGGYREILSQGRNFYIGRDNTGIIRLGDDWLNTGVAFPVDLQWHHYGVVRTGSNTFLYIDGNLAAAKGSAIGSPGVVFGTPNLFIIGSQFCQPCGENFNGQVDDITIWNTARTQTQIKTAMTSSVATNSTGLVAYYKLDEGTGTSTVNAVNGGNACVLSNGATWTVPSGISYNIGSYSWSTGASVQSINVTTSATYQVTVSNNYGCTKTATKKVTVNALPTANVTASGPLTFCAGGSVTFTANSGTGYSFQWKKNGSNISGATNISYTATTAGTYKVIVTKTNGCSKASTNKVVTINCRETIESIRPLSLSVYPNPASETITVSFDSEEPNAVLQILNITGQVVLQKAVETTEGGFEEPISVSGLAPGVYNLEIISGTNRSNIRFVKQ